MNQLKLEDKFKAFGFDVRIVDGHNVDALTSALGADSNLPICVIADTVKGKGVSFMEGVKTWHHSVLSKEQYDLAVKEVENA
jgi:transketolase